MLSMRNPKRFQTWVIIISLVVLGILLYCGSSQGQGLGDVADRAQTASIFAALCNNGVLGNEAKLGEPDGQGGFALVMGTKNEERGHIRVRLFEGVAYLESLEIKTPLALSYPILGEDKMRQSIFTFLGGEWEVGGRTDSVDPSKTDRWIEKAKRSEAGRADYIVQYEYGFRDIGQRQNDYDRKLAKAYLLGLKVFSWPVKTVAK